MTPFHSVTLGNDGALDWFRRNAVGPVGVLIWLGPIKQQWRFWLESGSIRDHYKPEDQFAEVL